MKVVFHTNVDNYRTNCWPDNLTIPPRIGETVLVSPVFIPYFKEQKLPTRMEVVDVVWGDDSVLCELWYKQIDVQSAKLSGINLFQ